MNVEMPELRKALGIARSHNHSEVSSFLHSIVGHEEKSEKEEQVPTSNSNNNVKDEGKKEKKKRKGFLSLFD